MNILITGINGLVGMAIAERLASQYMIYGIGRRQNCGIKCADYLRGDIGEKELYDRMLERWGRLTFDVIVHCAAEISNDIVRLYQTNCCGTQILSEFAKEVQCKSFIYLSSVPVIGMPLNIPITEEHEISPSTVYHRTKYLGEIIVEQTLTDVCEYKILRIASPLGTVVSEKKIAGAFLKACMEEKDIVIYGSGNRVQNYIDVEDVAYAVECAVNTREQTGIYLISGWSVTDRELAEICREVCCAENQILIKDPEKREEQWELNGEKAYHLLGYRPQITLRTTLEKIMRIWKKEWYDG